MIFGLRNPLLFTRLIPKWMEPKVSEFIIVRKQCDLDIFRHVLSNYIIEKIHCIPITITEKG